jgi:glycerol uptake facilitator-like aquaporin
MKHPKLSGISACFYEQQPIAPLLRRSTTEFVGTLMLALIAAGSGMTGQRLLVGDRAFALLFAATATSGGLVGLILALGKSSGGHFNPLISILQCLSGNRTFGCALAYVVAQLAGGASGAVIAATLSGGLKTVIAVSGPLWSSVASEFVAAAGLIIVVFGCSRSGRSESGPLAVGAWLMAAIIATPSTSYANPAMSFAALFAKGPFGLTPGTVITYVPVQLFGALVGLAAVTVAVPEFKILSSDPSIIDTEGDDG